MNKNLTIIGGCGSSGTTLLRHLIGRNKEVYTGPELNCFNHYELYRYRLLLEKIDQMLIGQGRQRGYASFGAFMDSSEAYGISKSDIKKWVFQNGDTKSFINHIVNHIGKKYGVEHFVEKTPTNVYCFDILSKSYPHYYLIHVIRDGRDVVASLKKRGVSLFSAGSRWLFDTLAGLMARGQKNYIEIRYEKLVKDPYGTMSYLLDRLEIPFDPNNIFKSYQNEYKQSEAKLTKFKQHKSWNNSPVGPISETSIGRYRNELNPVDLKILFRIRLSKRAKSRLNANVDSFKKLLMYLEYDISESEKENANEHFWGHRQMLNVTGMQLKDYYRRLKSNYKKNIIKPPDIYTYIR